MAPRTRDEFDSFVYLLKFCSRLDACGLGCLSPACLQRLRDAGAFTTKAPPRAVQ